MIKPAADAGADEDADEALGLGFEFGDVDAQGGRCCNRSPQIPARRGVFSSSFLSGTSFQPSRLGAKMTVPESKSTAPGRANADAGHLFECKVGFIHRVLDAAGDALDDGVDAALGFGAELGGADALQRMLEDPGKDLGAAQVDAHDVFCFAARFGHGGNSNRNQRGIKLQLCSAAHLLICPPARR